MKQYYRVILGKGSAYARECFAGGFIGLDFDFGQDLSGQFSEKWQDFNQKFIPVYTAQNPGVSKIAAGLACGMTWTFAKEMQPGAVILCPAGDGTYHVGEISGDYQYQPGEILPHRRPVRWLEVVIDRSAMSDGLRLSAQSAVAVCRLGQYAGEIEKLISPQSQPVLIAKDDSVEDPLAFAMEKHLEDFLISNWAYTTFGKDYQIYEENGVKGQQFPTDTGPIDILAISKDKKTLLVLELKKGRTSDVVVGQILRYMGYLKEQLAESDQEVRGVIIALEDDLRLRQALKMTPFIEFFRYEINFKLVKASSS